jgi:hypothetical protein
MGQSSTSVVSGSHARVLSYLSVRPYLTAGGAVATAGILVLSTVAAPPELQDTRAEVRAVHLTGSAVPPTKTWVATLEELSSNQARTGVLVSQVGGAADVTTVVMTTHTAGVAKSREFDPVPTPNTVDAVTLAATPIADLGAIFQPLLKIPVVGAAVAYTALFLVFFVYIPVAWFVEAVYDEIAGVLGLPPTLPLPGVVTATAYADTTPDLKVTSDPPLRDSAPVTIENVEQADAVRTTVTGKADVPPPVTSTDVATETESDGPTELATGNYEISQISLGTATSTGDATENATADEASTDPTAANAPEPTADPASEPAKPAARTRTPRPVEHGSPGLGRLRDLLRHDNADRPATRTAAVDDEEAPARPSSVKSAPGKSPSPGTKSPGGDSPGGDADDS